jgi:hypothetical protein
MELKKLPKDLLLEIIAKQNSTEYLTLNECKNLIEKAQERIGQISREKFNEFFTLSEDFYKYIGCIKISFHNDWLILEVEEGSIILSNHRYENNRVTMSVSHYEKYRHSDKKLMDELETFVRQNKELSYKFLLILKENSINNVLIL